MSEWKTYTVSDLEKSTLLKVEDGNHGEYRPRSNEFEKEGTFFIRSADIDNNRILFEAAAKINQVALARIRKGIGKPGDILFSSKGTIGKIAIAPLNCPDFVCSPQVTFWRSLDLSFLDRWFLYYFIQSSRFYHQVKARCRETDMAPYISLTNQREFEISVPDIKEQRNVTNVLSCLDRKIENLRKQNETLEAIAQALFKHWFIDFEFPNADGKPYKSSGGAMEPSELGEIPAGWRVGRLGDVVKVNAESISKEYQYEEVEYVDISSVGIGVLEGTTSYDLKDAPSRARRLVKHGDVVWSGVRPNRKSYLFISHPPQNLVISTGFITLTPDAIPSSYLYSWVTTESFVEYLTFNASGSAYPAVKAEHFTIAELLLPEPSILHKFHAVVNPMREKIYQNAQQVKTLTKTRDALLPKLMSGKLRIQDD